MLLGNPIRIAYCTKTVARNWGRTLATRAVTLCNKCPVCAKDQTLISLHVAVYGQYMTIVQFTKCSLLIMILHVIGEYQKRQHDFSSLVLKEKRLKHPLCIPSDKSDVCVRVCGDQNGRVFLCAGIFAFASLNGAHQIMLV